MLSLLKSFFGTKRTAVSSTPATIQLTDLDNAWLSPQGDWHVVPCENHDRYMRATLDMGELTAERLGWVKLSKSDWFFHKTCTQAQFDAIFDWHQANRVTFHPESYPLE